MTAGVLKVKQNNETEKKKALFDFEKEREKLLRIGRERNIDFAAAIREIQPEVENVKKGDKPVSISKKALKSRLIKFGYLLSDLPDATVDILARKGDPSDSKEAAPSDIPLDHILSLFQEEITKETVIGKAKGAAEEDDDSAFALTHDGGVIHIEVIDAPRTIPF